jgi:hypothetical protein
MHLTPRVFGALRERWGFGGGGGGAAGRPSRRRRTPRADASPHPPPPREEPAPAPEPVSRAFPSWNRSILTEIYLCHVCSYHEVEDRNGRAGTTARAGTGGGGR